MRVVGVAAVISLAAACSAPAHRANDPARIANRSIALLYLPTERQLYVEIAANKTRRAEFDVNVAGNALAQATGGGLGSWLGVAAAGEPTSRAAFTANPYALVAAVLVAPLVNATIDATRNGRARRLAERFNELLPAAEGHARLAGEIQAAVDGHAELTLPAEQVTLVEYERKDFDDEAYLAGVTADTVLVVSSVATFTPRFEILEVTLRYSLFDPDSSVDESVFANLAVAQSKVHGGARGDDTRDELQVIADEWVAWKLAEMGEMDAAESARAHARLSKRAERMTAGRLKRYKAFDDHDREGDLWFADDGRRFREALAAAHREAARLMVLDLFAPETASGAQTAVPPGYGRELTRVPAMDAADRVVYRLESGAVVSIDAKSRFIPF